MVETALGFAMKKAGDVDEMLLRSVAYAELGKVNRDVMRALAPFLEEVRDAGGLMVKMVRPETARREALEYLRGVVAADMARVPAKAGDGVHSFGVSQPSTGPVEDTSGGGGVQFMDGSQEARGAPSPLDAKTGEGGVQTLHKSHCIDSVPSPVDEKVGEDSVHTRFDGHDNAGASSPIDSSAGEGVQRDVEFQRRHGPSPAETNAEGGSSARVTTTLPMARPSAIPNKPRGLVAMQTLRTVDKSILEMRVLSDGETYGEARWQTLLSRADKLLRASIGNVREAALMYLTYNYARPPQLNCQVKDVIKPNTARDLMRKADRITPDALAILIKRAAETTEAIDA